MEFIGLIVIAIVVLFGLSALNSATDQWDGCGCVLAAGATNTGGQLTPTVNVPRARLRSVYHMRVTPRTTGTKSTAPPPMRRM